MGALPMILAEPCDGQELSELDQLQTELVKATEERNMLLNELEWKEGPWRNEIEELEQQIFTERLELTAKFSKEVQEMKQRFEEESMTLRLKLRGEQEEDAGQ